MSMLRENLRRDIFLLFAVPVSGVGATYWLCELVHHLGWNPFL